MCNRPSFEEIVQQAQCASKLIFTAKDLADFGKWLAYEYDIADPKEIEYVRERVCLISPDSSACDSDKVLAYLAALGQLVIWNTSEQYQNEKQKVLRRFLTKVRRRETSPVSPESTELYYLLDEDLYRNTRAKSSGETDEKPWIDGSLLYLPADGTLYVASDLHGDAHTVSLLDTYFRRQLDRATKARPTYIVFAGDYVNNGLRSIEMLVKMLRLRQDFPENVFLLSGNHDFAETYATAFTEYFETHWLQWQQFSAEFAPKFKAPPKHYGHIRLELVRRYGITTGEAIYAKFAEWGKSLPFLARSDKGILICHSVGLNEDSAPPLTIADFVRAKDDPVDVGEFDEFGYEAWRERRKTLHSQMVNNRTITNSTLDQLAGVLNVKVFVVGHRHYRSGDRDCCQDGLLKPAGLNEDGRLLTVCSSHPRSPDAGHYIAHEFEMSRQRASRAEGRMGVAYPCIAQFDDKSVDSVHEENIHPLASLVQENQQ
ncbi:MAG: hypothetical protein GY832_24700 [Chloroflexi bacterium]|nr:hypothetical protein [Chloroflexota bacterium]